MAKPYREGRGWAIRCRYRGRDIYLSGYASAADASRAAEAEKVAMDRLGAAVRDGPRKTTLATALVDYARERLPYLKGARQDAQRINNYLRTQQMPVVRLSPVETPGKGVRYFDVTLQPEAARTVVNSLKTHRAGQLARGAGTTAQRRRLARMTVADITRHDIQLLMNAMKDDGFSAATISLERAELMRLFNYASSAWNWAQPAVNPATGLDMPKIDNARDRVLTNGEWQKITAALDGYSNTLVVPAIALLLQTAMRSSEPLLRATWADVDWERCVLHLSDSKNGKRDVPLSPGAIESLRLLQARAGQPEPGAKILPTTYEALKKAWTTACRRAGVEGVKLHDLRHTAATRYALEYNGNIPVLKVITGHRTDAMLMRYIHVKAQDVVAMMHGRPLAFEHAPAGYICSDSAQPLPPSPPPVQRPAPTSNVLVVDFSRRTA